MLVLDTTAMRQLVKTVGLEAIMQRLIARLHQDFKRWDAFTKSPRHAIYCEQGVLELMPTADGLNYAMKYVNGHPINTQQGKLCVTGLGLYTNMHDGYPLMIAEMTWLTAIRTACVSALATQLMARPESRCLGIIGTGAQAEFQVLALMQVLPQLEKVLFFDKDTEAMHKFAKNMEQYELIVEPAQEAKVLVQRSDVLITATAAKSKVHVIEDTWVQEGTHICALGGDSPGKTELPVSLLKRAYTVVEYRPQSQIEGEIQNLPVEAQQQVPELWQIVKGDQLGRPDAHAVTLFDSVGFALEDFSALALVYELAQEKQLGQQLTLVPAPPDPKDLFADLFSI